MSTLCQACGLCCGGALFTFLPVTAAERERLAARGARTELRRDGRLALLLPCAVLKGTQCGAYDERPQRCREYVCELAKAVERGERPMEAALSIVGEAKEQLAALEQRVGPAESGDARGVLQRARAAQAQEPDDAAFRALRAAARELEAMLRQYFIGPY